MFKRKICMNEELKLGQVINNFSIAEIQTYKDDLITVLKNFDSKISFQKFEQALINHPLCTFESFICLDGDLEDNEVAINKGVTKDNLASKISSVISLLSKKNKTELDYVDLLMQREVLIQSLEQNFFDKRIDLDFMRVTISFDENLVLSSSGAVSYAKHNLPIHGVVLNGDIKQYLKEQRDVFGNLITDVYRSQLGDLLNSKISEDNFPTIKPYLKEKYSDLIEKFGLRQIDEDLVTGHELKETLMAWYGNDSDIVARLNCKTFEYLPIRFQICDL